MRAIVIQQFGGPEQLAIQELPDPEAKSGHVVIEVKAFGVNHAETHMRKGEWAEAAKVSGIECVGYVRDDADGRFAAGQKVVAFMGGMGRQSTAATPNSRGCQRATWWRLTPIFRGRNLPRFLNPMRRLGLACMAIWRWLRGRRWSYEGLRRRSARRR